MSFKQFLVENAQVGNDLIAKLHAIEDLINPVRFERSKAIIRKFEEEIAEGSVYNVTLVEAKDAVTSLIRNAWEGSFDKHSFWWKWDHPVEKELRAHDLDISHYVDGGSVRKADRTLAAAERLIKDHDALKHFTMLRRLADAFIYCLDAFKAAQPKAIKGRKPAAPDPNKFTSRMGSAHAVATVRSALLKSITPPLEQYEEQVAKYFKLLLSRVDSLVDGREIGNDAYGNELGMVPLDDFELQMVMQATYAYRSRGYGEKRRLVDLKREANADEYPAQEAKRQRRQIEEGFLHKNALKMSALIDAKGNLTSIDSLPTAPVKLHGSSGTLTAELNVKFADGSSFMVRNKVIINRSHTGKSFYQFPTTFHDVVLPDGKTLEAPSEEKMLKVFGGTA